MTDKKIVLTTVGSHEEARKIAEALVEGHLAACVNIVSSVESVYHWQGKLERAQEWLLIIKTTESAFIKVREAISELHSYDLPECVLLSIEDGNPAYLEWIRNSVIG
jgi:periplasmic divalent cation tolerance protein